MSYPYHNKHKKVAGKRLFCTKRSTVKHYVKCPKCQSVRSTDNYNLHIIDCWKDMSLFHLRSIPDFSSEELVRSIRQQDEKLEKRLNRIAEERRIYQQYFEKLREYNSRSPLSDISEMDEDSDYGSMDVETGEKDGRYLHDEYTDSMMDIWKKANESMENMNGVHPETIEYLEDHGIRFRLNEQCNQCSDYTCSYCFNWNGFHSCFNCYSKTLDKYKTE